MSTPSRLSARVAALVAAGSLAACAPAVGPYEAGANQAAAACQQGWTQACYDYQRLAPAAQAEAAQNAQNAAAGTAVAAGLVGAVAGAAIVGASRDRPRHYGRPYHRGRYHYR